MLRHFSDATAARDAVIAGRPQEARAPLLRLATRDDDSEVHADWVPWLEEMRSTAAHGAEATTLAASAEAVAQLGTTCGDCHRTTRGGPDEGASPAYDPQGKRGLSEKMARHRYAADALWVGITGPMHQEWAHGAAALMNITVPGLVTHRGDPATSDRAPSGEGELQGEADPRLPSQERDPEAAGTEPSSAHADVDLDPELRALRALGVEADRAQTASDKQRVFAQIGARCGACHARLGITP